MVLLVQPVGHERVQGHAMRIVPDDGILHRIEVGGDVLVDLQPTPINLHSQDVFQVDLTYDGTTLTEKITDLNTSNSFTVPGGYVVDIPSMVGGNTAFLGFTGGTGGLTAIQDVQIWTFRNP